MSANIHSGIKSESRKQTADGTISFENGDLASIWLVGINWISTMSVEAFRERTLKHVIMPAMSVYYEL